MAVAAKEIELTGILDAEYQLVLDFIHLQGMRNILRSYIGKPLVIKLKERVKRRSDKQNRYYFGVAVQTIRAFLKETEGKNYTQDQVHTYNLMTVIGAKPIITDLYGVEVVSFDIKRSSDMTTTEFKEFVEELQAYWALRGCIIPDPKGDNYITDFL